MLSISASTIRLVDYNNNNDNTSSQGYDDKNSSNEIGGYKTSMNNIPPRTSEITADSARNQTSEYG